MTEILRLPVPHTYFYSGRDKTIVLPASYYVRRLMTEDIPPAKIYGRTLARQQEKNGNVSLTLNPHPWIFSDRENPYRIEDNKINIPSGWDFRMMTVVLEVLLPKIRSNYVERDPIKEPYFKSFEEAVRGANEQGVRVSVENYFPDLIAEDFYAYRRMIENREVTLEKDQPDHS